MSDWLDTYKSIAEVVKCADKNTDSILFLAVSEMNPRHPVTLKNQELVERLTNCDHENKKSISLLKLLSTSLLCILFSVAQSLNVICRKIRSCKDINSLKNKKYSYILKSWFIEQKDNDNNNDFYFGNIAEHLYEYGYTGLIIGDHPGPWKFCGYAVKNKYQESKLRYDEKLFLPLWAPIWIALKQISEGYSLYRNLIKEKNDTKKIIYYYILSSLLSPSTAQHVAYYFIVKNAIKKLQASIFITLYEGQPWERAARCGAREANPQCMLIGYQHSIVLPHALTILNPASISNNYLYPDLIVCTGNETKNMLATEDNLLNTKLITLGSFKTKRIDTSINEPDNTKKVILVIPEGVPDESILLFDFVMSAADKLKDWRIIFRTHPILPFEKIRSQLNHDPIIHKNIEISSNSDITDDCVKSSVVIYRGSTAVFTAIKYGIKPVYLDIHEKPKVDPLWRLKTWKIEVKDVNNMIDELRKYNEEPINNLLIQWKTATKYVDEYMMPVSEVTVKRLMQEIQSVKERRSV